MAFSLTLAFWNFKTSGPCCGAGVQFQTLLSVTSSETPLCPCSSWSGGLSASPGLPAPLFSYIFPPGLHLHIFSSTFWDIYLVVFSLQLGF